MAQYNSFEDLPIWKESRVIANAIYHQSSVGAFASDYGLRDQIRRAAVSIMSNVAEGFDRESNKEFVRFLSIAKASLAEVRSQLFLALDLAYIPSDDHSKLNEQLKKLGAEIAGFMRYLEQNQRPPAN